MPEHAVRLGVEPIEVAEGVLVERDDIVAMMVVGDGETKPRPEPFRGVRLGVVGWGVDESKPSLVPLESLSQKLRAFWGVDAEIVEEHDRRTVPRLGALDQVIELETEDVSRATKPIADRDKAVAPVEGAEADEPSARTRRTNEPLTSAALPTPDSRQRRMEPNVDLVLDVEVGGGKQAEKLRDIGRDFRPEVVVDEIVPVEVRKGGGLKRSLRSGLGNGWSIQARGRGRGHGGCLRKSRRGKEDLHPQAFPR